MLSLIFAGAIYRFWSLITARKVINRGSDFMMLPGSPFDPRLDGCNQLIRDRAIATDAIEFVKPPIKS